MSAEIIGNSDLDSYQLKHQKRVEVHGHKYHQDATRYDYPGETFRVVGRFEGSWFVDLYETRQQLVDEHWNDTDTIGAMSLLDNTPAVFQKMLDSFQFKRVINCRLQNQKPGSTVVYHHDDFSKFITKGEKVVRIIIFLEDYSPGQVMVFGNYTFDRWTKGVVVFSDYEGTPHATANASHNERAIILITAVASEATTEKIAYGMGTICV